MLTPYEFYLFSKGAIENEKEAWNHTAQLAAWLGKAWSKDFPSADRLLGRSSEVPLFSSEKDFHDYMRSREK